MFNRSLARVTALFSTAVLLSSCGNDRTPSEPDPDEVELKAIDQAASALDLAARESVDQLSALGDAFDERLTDDDIVVLFRNHAAFLEAMGSNTQFVPDAAFLALVERLRDLPFLELLPEPVDAASELTSALRSEHLDQRAGALYISTLEPGCALPCTLQASTWAMLDLSITTLEKYFGGLVASGVDCAKSIADSIPCFKEPPKVGSPCGRAEMIGNTVDCAAFIGEVGLELSPLSKAKQAYALSKLIIGLWGAGRLAVASQAWVEKCRAYQAAGCPEPGCGENERKCLAVNGVGSKCCPTSASCVECGACAEPCGETCCALGQRCDGGVCTTCTVGCGSRCCVAGEFCPEPESGTCELCGNPCGTTCCEDDATCIAATGTCCDSPCGTECCGDDEECISDGGPPSCCDRPCGGECCDPDQLCDPNGGGCVVMGGCDDLPPVNCSQMCTEAAQQFAEQCAAKEGVLTPLNIPECVSACSCKLNQVPDLIGCLMGLACVGCDKLESVVDTCGTPEAKCVYTIGD
ncbi:MAG: hypothetical protein IV100_04375 [Myxococcales bacterium]|nr:hypothetical protein [Myxococcales bacterium]